MTLLIWHDGDFRELPLAENYRMLIIDSWRHSFGKSFGLGQHLLGSTRLVGQWALFCLARFGSALKHF